MRKIAAVLVLFIAIGAVMPFGMGYMAERQINKIAQRLSERPQFTVTVENYKRGYFDSSATVNIVYKAIVDKHNKTSPESVQATFQLQQTIKHGPILSTSDGMRFGMAYAKSDLVLSEDAKAALNEIFKDQEQKPEFIVDSMIHVNGSSEHNFRIPTYHYKLADKVFTTSGIHGTWEMSSNMDYHTGNLNFGNFVAKEADGVIRVNAPEIIFEVNQNQLGLFTGKSRVSFPSFEVQKQGVSIYQIKNLELNSNTDISSDFYHMSFDGAFENMMVDRKNYGPCILKTSLRNLDAAKILELQKLIDQMQDPNTPSDQQQMLLFSMMAKIPEIFNRGAEFSVDPFSLKLPQGKMELTGHAKLAPGDNSKAAVNPFSVLQRLNGQLKVTVPKQIAHEMMFIESRDKVIKMERFNQLRMKQQAQTAEQMQSVQPLTPQQIDAKAKSMADATLQSLQTNGYIKLDGDNYVVDAKIDKGMLTVNGKQLPNQMFGGMVH